MKKEGQTIILLFGALFGITALWLYESMQNIEDKNELIQLGRDLEIMDTYGPCELKLKIFMGEYDKELSPKIQKLLNATKC